MKRFLSAFTALLSFSLLMASVAPLEGDSLLVATNEVSMSDSIPVFNKAPKWAKDWLNSLIRGHIDRTRERRLDLSFAVTPSYTREAGFGIGGAATGLYRLNRLDSITPPSDVFASLNASINGFFVLTIRGNTIFRNDKSRLSYKLESYIKALDFWGIRSADCDINHKSSYTRRQIDLQSEYVVRLPKNFFIGLQTRFDYTDARNVKAPDYFLGERPQYFTTGIGALIEWDSRDNILTPTRGAHFAFKPMVYPAFLGNSNTTAYSYNFIANAYISIGRHSTVAFDLYAKSNSSRIPWTLREQLASDGVRMRGYYMGRYIDCNQLTFQAEYRQHIYKRFGAVAWGGVGSVFDHPKNFKNAQWLYNFGFGLRFEFKHNVNARIDYGFGKHTSGILFAIGEAF